MTGLRPLKNARDSGARIGKRWTWSCCATCLIESRISNSESPRAASADLVVRRLLGDRHVVHVALPLAGTGDAHEPGLRAHVLDAGAAHVAHGGAQAAGELVDDAAERTAVRHAAFDALGHQLVGIARILEIAVLGPLLHRAQRTHAAIALVAAA